MLGTEAPMPQTLNVVSSPCPTSNVLTACGPNVFHAFVLVGSAVQAVFETQEVVGRNLFTAGVATGWVQKVDHARFPVGGAVKPSPGALEVEARAYEAARFDTVLNVDALPGLLLRWLLRSLQPFQCGWELV